MFIYFFSKSKSIPPNAIYTYKFLLQKHEEKILNKTNSYYNFFFCYLFCYLGVEIIRSDNTSGILTIVV